MARIRHSAISWTDFSGGDLNFVIRGQRGDCECSPGCERCYALRIGERFGFLPKTTTIYPEKLERLARWQPKPPYKRGPGSRPMAFVVDMGDLFHEKVPTSIICRFLQIVAKRQDIDWQVLTKRSKRMAELFNWEGWRRGVYPRKPEQCPWPLPNLHLGVSVESSDYLWRIRDLLNTPAAVRFVSLEPMLKRIDPSCLTKGISWCIVGGESGFGRRPFQKEWAIPVRDHCASNDIAFFFKQGSSQYPGQDNLLEGQRHEEWPE